MSSGFARPEWANPINGGRANKSTRQKEPDHSSIGLAVPSFSLIGIMRPISMKLLTSQLSVAKWHAQIGDPTVADSVLDRLVNAAHNSRVSRCGKREAEGT